MKELPFQDLEGRNFHAPPRILTHNPDHCKGTTFRRHSVMCDGEMNVRISANVTLSGIMANLGFNDEINVK